METFLTFVGDQVRERVRDPRRYSTNLRPSIAEHLSNFQLRKLEKSNE